MFTTIARISLRHHLHSAGLYARLTWQVLFDYYRNHNADLLDDMDSMLCDLGTLERLFQSKAEGFTVCWGFTGCHTTMVDDLVFAEVQLIDFIRIVFEPKSEAILFIHHNESKVGKV